MIHFEKYTLSNGLRVLIHQDKSTPQVAVNVLYDVGSRDEHPEKTGLAHLLEHLMFSGSVNISDFDTPLQAAGGESNAYTSADFTSYQIELPAENIETAFWLESDRMLGLSFNEGALEVQRRVVSEEFRQTYCNDPYGEVLFKLHELAYTKHPYRWMPMGQLKHIEAFQMEDVKRFFFQFYRPANAILVVAGNIQATTVFRMAEKWFGGIPSGVRFPRHLPSEPPQEQSRRLDMTVNAPPAAIYLSFPIPGLCDTAYPIVECITQVLSGGLSSQLHQHLVKNRRLFDEINCFATASIDPGMITLHGTLTENSSHDTAMQALCEELEKISVNGILDNDLEKIKNQMEAHIVFANMTVQHRAQQLAMYELLGDANTINTELQCYQSITSEDIRWVSHQIFDHNRSNMVYCHCGRNYGASFDE